MRSIEDVVAFLIARRLEAGSPSYAEIARRVVAIRQSQGVAEFEARVSRSTVYDVFDRERRRLDAALVADIARSLGVAEEEAGPLVGIVGRLQGHDDAGRVATAARGVPAMPPLVGRARELREIEQAPSGSLLVVSGLGGIGKSHLVFTAAARWSADEVVQVDLRGNDTDLRPITPAAAQAALVRVLGHAVVPAEPDERSALLARLLDERAWIVVLDDAADAEQVAGVLPDDLGRSIVIVTARRRLGLPGSIELPLDPLPEDDALAMLAAQAPPGAVESDPLAARSLVATLSGIPLALTLTAARLASRPEWSLDDHARQLTERMAQARLDEPLSAVLASTYAGLGPEHRRALRLLAAQPLGDLETDALAVLWDLESGAADGVLAQLDAAHLVAHRGARTGLHDVVRAFAHDRGLDEDPHSMRSSAMDRLADHLVERAWQAHVGLHVAGEACLYGAREARVAALPEEEARSWLDSHAEQLLTLAATVEGDRPDVVVELSGSLSSWLNASGRHQDGRWLHGRAVSLAARSDDPLAAARARLALGHSLVRLGDEAGAEQELARARPLFEAASEPGAVRVLLSLLALTDYQAQRFERAAARFDEMVLAARAAGSAYEETIALGNAGDCLRAAGRLDQAAVRIHEALLIAEREGLGMVRAANLVNLAQLLTQLGRLDDALARAEEGLTAAAEFGDFLVGHGLLARAGALIAAGRAEEARADLDRAQVIADELGDTHLAAEIVALTQG